MNLKLNATVLLLLFLLLESANAVVPRTWTPGVAVGDYFTYEMYGVFTSNRSNTTMVIPQFEYNNTEWVRINITSIDGSMINQVYTLYFKNQSKTELNFKTDINPTNENSSSYGQAVPICAANLVVGNRIPTAELTINQTVNWAYLSGSRETNHAAWNVSDDWGNCYFDRETGMLVEFLRTHRFANNSTGEVIEKTDVINLIGTNRWEINNSQSPIMLYFVFLAASSFALLSFVVITYRFVIRKRHNGLVVKEIVNYK
jgi:hypothetical protein